MRHVSAQRKCAYLSPGPGSTSLPPWQSIRVSWMNYYAGLAPFILLRRRLDHILIRLSTSVPFHQGIIHVFRLCKLIGPFGRNQLSFTYATDGGTIYTSIHIIRSIYYRCNTRLVWYGIDAAGYIQQLCLSCVTELNVQFQLLSY
jgi:hypothetical protein